jgi:hypothetical protein
MKAFIIMFNRLTWPQKLCQDLTNSGCEVILIDNNSTYQPLKYWYKTCQYKVHYTQNLGCKSLWLSGIINQYTDEYYIVTDHDLDISGLPRDWIKVLMDGFTHNVTKSGLSLKIDDLPDNPFANEVKEFESRFWESKLGKYYSAPIDTTLAIYSRERMKGIRFPFDLIDDSHSIFWNAVRSPKGYEARHLPWYSTPDTLSDEEKYYIKHIGNDGFWTRKFNEAWKQ